MHSYRVEDSECNSRLPSNDRNELKTQSRMCTSQQTVRSQRITQQKHQHTDRKSHPRGPMHNSKWEKTFLATAMASASKLIPAKENVKEIHQEATINGRVLT